MAREDYSHHVNKHASPTVRLLFAALGGVFLLLGVLGAFLPLLPTTPFMLLAAACFARASTRFYNWLLNTKTFGPAIVEWRLHRSIPYRIKLVAISTMAVTLTISILLVVRERWLQGLIAGCGVLLAVWMYRLPSRDRRVNARPDKTEEALPRSAGPGSGRYRQPPRRSRNRLRRAEQRVPP